MLDYGARFYDPSVGRWTSVDPLADDAPGWTPYRYGFNNPLSYTDPTGMMENAITTTVVDANGKVIYHKNDDDNNIYYSSDGVQGRDGNVSGLPVLGQEKRGYNYRVGESLPWGHLSNRGQQIYLEDGLDVNSMTEEWEGVFDMADYGLAFSGLSSGRPFRSKGPRRFNIKLPSVSRKFNLNDPKTFERASPKEIIEYLKKQGWEIISARQGKTGFRAINPKNPSDVIHIIQGNADKLKSGTEIMTVKQGDYLKRPALNWERIPLK